MVVVVPVVVVMPGVKKVVLVSIVNVLYGNGSASAVASKQPSRLYSQSCLRKRFETSAPSKHAAAWINSTMGSPAEAFTTGKNKVPRTAPSFPEKADIPWHVDLICVGKQIAGKTYVPTFGPKQSRKLSKQNKENNKVV